MSSVRKIVVVWTGNEAKALRIARRMSTREFADHLGVSDRMVAKWESAGRDVRPQLVNQAALDTSLGRADDGVHVRFGRLRDELG